jgi:uncharacterized protein (DUF433 family)
MTDSEILEAYPDLEAGDIRDAVRYAEVIHRESRMRVDAPDRRRPFVDVNS